MTALELLQDALAKADECSPPVRAFALLHAARVMARFDEVEGTKAFATSLARVG